MMSLASSCGPRCVYVCSACGAKRVVVLQQPPPKSVVCPKCQCEPKKENAK